ncbi:extracellular serine proteinase-like [Glandiceps talaboti]
MSIKLTSLLVVVSSLSFTTGVPLEPIFDKDDAMMTVTPRTYIVVLKEHHDKFESRNLIDRVPLGRLNKVKKFEKIFNGFSAEMEEETMEMIRAYSEVDYIEADTVIHAYDYVHEDVGSWGLDRIDQRNLPLDDNYNPAGDGTGVDVYIFDTGIRYDHEEFEGRAKPFFDAFEEPAPNGDCHGHGTHCAGTIGGRTYGVAKNVNLWGVRILNCNGTGSSLHTLIGMEEVYAVASTPAVISMSIGGNFSATINLAVNFLADAGFTIVVAAGNSNGPACTESPASSPQVITVASSGNTDEISWFSNYGECVDIFAPGERITSAYISSPTSLAVLSGTSMATPHVSGAAAIVLQLNPSLSPEEVKQVVMSSATPCHITGDIKESVNLLLYISDRCQISENTCTFDRHHDTFGGRGVEGGGGGCGYGHVSGVDSDEWWWWWMWRRSSW